MSQESSTSQSPRSIRVIASAIRRPLELKEEPTLINVSEKSLLIRCQEVSPPGTAMNVTLVFVELDRELELRAEVAWASESLHDMALKIVEVDDEGVTLIRRFLAEVAKRR